MARQGGKKIEYLEIAREPDFTSVQSNCMLLEVFQGRSSLMERIP